MSDLVSRRTELLGTTLRRMLRRGARGKISRLLEKERPEDVASCLRRLTPDEQFRVFEILSADLPEGAVETLTLLDSQERARIVGQLAPEAIASVLNLLAVDDAAFIIGSLPDELKASVLEIVDLDDALAEVQTHLGYRDDSAGRIMDPEFVALREDSTVADAIATVRRIARDVDMISYVYVVDRFGHLQGVASLRQLLLSEPGAVLGSVMTKSPIKVAIDTDQEEVAQLAARYDLLAIPVVDASDHLVGIVTVDDILDVFKQEATEDFYKMAGTSDDEIVYQERVFKVAGIRMPWLLFNLVGLLGAGVLTLRFEETIQLSLLIGFIPVIMGMAGNIGSQTATIAVRGLATGRLALGQGRIVPFVWQQLKVGLVLGVVSATLVGLATLGVNRQPVAAVIVASSLLLTVQLASFNGAILPILFRRLGIDPAVASAPLVTTSNDVLGILIYFGISHALLGTFSLG
ncbi:MAG: magnesium transporter [Acidobacteriota bacterium]